MGKIKNVLIGAAALCCPFLAGTSSAVGSVVRSAAYYSAGVFTTSEFSGISDSSDSSKPPESAPQVSSVTGSAENQPPEVSSVSSESSSSEPVVDEPPQKLGRVITINRTEGADDADYSQFTDNDGEIYRYNFGKSKSTEYITLGSGAQVRNCTEVTNGELSAAALAELDFGELDSELPSVLIYHTHTCESFLPYGDSFDADYPLRSGDPSKNMTAVGDAICESLSQRGISVVHDCAVYDSPMFTGAYYRSAEGMLDVLEKYPSVKIVLDIHRDGIINADGSLPAPVAEIDGKNAAQFMIITGCDDGEMDMPDYMENFKLACLLQNCAENAYPDLARAVLFDYRNYNQSLSTGALLIEVGSHGNSLDEAVYTGELLGNVIADALESGSR
ncbi:MAG: stage II sporulation protein P [Lachnospiraceae bacterium]|nr:stage II sporulation protein P [Ruminococcus sp.]MCM1274358.1 stage II sporulation protein P [Lachnospiraceae bacterium]